MLLEGRRLWPKTLGAKGIWGLDSDSAGDVEDQWLSPMCFLGTEVSWYRSS